MDSTQKFCFKHSSGEDIYLFNLRNNKGTEVTITNYGAIIVSFTVLQKDGSKNDIVLGFDRVEDYFSPPYSERYMYFGAAIGRYGNRIQDARFNIDGKDYRLAKNMGDNNLHGGKEGFDKKAWTVVTFNEKKPEVHLRYKSIDGEEGFPGELITDLFVKLTDENELQFNYTAQTDKATAVNLTHHSYFNLNNGKGDIRGHFLQVYSNSILEQDDQLCATGKLIPVDNTPWDFRKARSIDEKWKEDGFDQSFVVENKKEGLTLMAEAWSESSGIKLQVLSTDPIVHLYTGQGITSLKGKNNVTYGAYSGFCLETQKHPNAINVPHFPNTILRPLEIYRQQNSYRVISF